MFFAHDAPSSSLPGSGLRASPVRHVLWLGQWSWDSSLLETVVQYLQLWEEAWKLDLVTVGISSAFIVLNVRKFYIKPGLLTSLGK